MKHSIKLNTETTFMKCSLILVLLLLVFPMVSAIISIDTSKIHIYMIDNISNAEDTEITFRVDFNTSENPVINDETFVDFTLNISGLEGLIWTSPDITYVLESNITPERLDLLEEWKDCLVQKGQYNLAWTKCGIERDECLEKYEGKNATTYKEDLNECGLSLKEKGLDLDAKNDKILNLEDEKEGTKNSKYIWGVVGLLLGAGALYLYERRGGSPKEKAMGEFQKSQAR